MSIQIIHGDTLNVALPEGSVNLMVTSPPYNLGKDYDDSFGYQEYLDWTEKWLKNVHRWLAPDGRVCLNVPLDTTRGGRRPVGADLTHLACDHLFHYHTTIVWNEGNISCRTAWGSFRSASAPYVTTPVELVLVLYKGQKWKRLARGESGVTREEFVEWTNGLWSFPGASARKVGHPAPFPLELPRRLIKMFSYEGDTVLDPFLGSGTTLMACRELNRRGIGIERDVNYVRLAERRTGAKAAPDH